MRKEEPMRGRESGQRQRGGMRNPRTSRGSESERMSREQLYAKAKEMGIGGRSRMKKDQLIQALSKK